MSELQRHADGTWTFESNGFKVGEVVITNRSIGHNYLKLRITAIALTGNSWAPTRYTAIEEN